MGRVLGFGGQQGDFPSRALVAEVALKPAEHTLRAVGEIRLATMAGADILHYQDRCWQQDCNILILV